ncbi:MAG TPA: preprotein translocase subunit SecE [Acidobacteriota bacterium]|nr:preprotein translocase subunit SecE [Acidobacteriota bacterium]
MLQKVKEAPKKAAVFYGDVKSELKKVTWPGKKEVWATTIVVLVTVFFFGAYLFLVDFVLQYAVNWVYSVFL